MNLIFSRRRCFIGITGSHRLSPQLFSSITPSPPRNRANQGSKNQREAEKKKSPDKDLLHTSTRNNDPFCLSQYTVFDPGNENI